MKFSQAFTDRKLFGPLFGETFSAWLAFAKALDGRRMNKRERALYEQCTGRSKAPTEPFSEAWVVAGRRAGKGRVSSAIAAHRATFADHSDYLGPGERAMVMCLASDKTQARVAFRYVRGLLEIPMLAPLVEGETKSEIELSTSATVQVYTSNYRAVRGVTCAAAILDECAFWPNDEHSASSDIETDAALTPALATSPNSIKLATSTPYSKRGLLFEKYAKHWGVEDSPALVWKAPSRLMNPTLDERMIEDALERDESRARAEWLGEFRDDVAGFLSRDAVNVCVEDGCTEIPPVEGRTYHAFADPSGGSRDSFTAAVSHRDENGCAVLDAVREIRPPFDPASATAEIAGLFQRYGLRSCRGDAYAGEWVPSRFAEHGVEYRRSEMTRSQIYLEVLPMVNSRQVRLLDLPRLINQLCGLERRTGRSGRDVVDHSPNSHDDVANSAAGALVLASGAGGYVPVGVPILTGRHRNVFDMGGQSGWM